MLKFKKPSTKVEQFPVEKAKSQGQGLVGKTVKIKGNSDGPTRKISVASSSKKDSKDSKSSKKSKSSGDDFKYLKTGKSTFPVKHDFFEKLAAADDQSVISSASSASVVSAASGASGAGSSISNFSSVSSASTGRYSGSFGSSGSSVRVDKSFDILREQRKVNPFGLTNDELEEAEKQDILGRLHSLRMKGSVLSKNFTLRSSLAELRMEMGRLEAENDTKRAVMRMRRWLMAGASGLQYLTNAKFAPVFIKGKFDGFSDYVLSSIEDYDVIFEKLAQKYGGLLGSTGKPLVDLLILLASQVLLFLFMQSKTGVKPPTPEEIQKNYPDLMKRMEAEAKEKANKEFNASMAAARAQQAQAEANAQAEAQARVQAQAQAMHFTAMNPDMGRRPMRFPSFTVPLVSIPMQQVNTGNIRIEEAQPYDQPFMQGDVFDLLQKPEPTDLYELHGSVTPEIEEIPMSPQEEEKLEFDTDETFPRPPSELTKTIQMPERSVNTRKPKAKTPAKVGAEKEKPQEEKKTLEI